MSRTAPTTPPATPAGGQVAYAEDAGLYDARTHPFDRWRRRLVELLPVRRGDVVLDVGCGTGRCFPLLRERVGPDGVIVGVDSSPDMLALAAERVAARGWDNVILHETPAEELDLPGLADHVVLCAVHDVLQSDVALANVLEQVRPRGGIAAGGGKWAPPWAVGLNMMTMAAHASFIADFTGFDRPWARLATRVDDLRVDEVAMGAGYLAVGRARTG